MLTEKEIRNARMVFAELGFEHTIQELKNSDMISDLELVKTKLAPVLPSIADAISRCSKPLNLKEFTKEMEEEFGVELSEEICEQYLYMIKVFEYDD
jgi:hypothetical protein